MKEHKGKRLFITGIPTSGKSYLAAMLVEEMGGIVVKLDDFRDALEFDGRYKQWVNFYFNQDEEAYLTTTSPEQMWENLKLQSEALWPAFLEHIDSYAEEPALVIFESVNILPHLAHRDLGFPGVCLIGASYKETLERNQKDPRWSDDNARLQEMEANMFFNVERPRYKEEAEKYGYAVFEDFETALQATRKILAKNT